MLALLFVTSAMAQDSYRDAVKQYLTATGAFDNTKSAITGMTMLLESDGQVDIDQLTKSYFDERLEDDMVSAMSSLAKTLGMTETDLMETAPLFSGPKNKVLQTHLKEMAKEYAAAIYKPFFEKMSQKDYKPFKTDVDPSEDIDAWIMDGGIYEILWLVF